MRSILPRRLLSASTQRLVPARVGRLASPSTSSSRLVFASTFRGTRARHGRLLSTMADALAGGGVDAQTQKAGTNPAAAPATPTANGKRPHPDDSSPGHPPANEADGTASAAAKVPGGQPTGSRNSQRQKPPKKKVRGGRRRKAVTDGSAEEVLLADVEDLMQAMRLGREEEEEEETGGTVNDDSDNDPARLDDLPAPGTELELEVVELSSTGEGLAVERLAPEQQTEAISTRRRNRIYVLSFAVPGDIVRARVFRHLPPPYLRARDDDDTRADTLPTYSVADFLELVRPSPELRSVGEDGNSNSGPPGTTPGTPPDDDTPPSTTTTTTPRCAYFGRCAGCQYQMLDYAEQLRVKRRVVERAYRHFAQLPPERVPAVLPTVASPLQYGYRTKLTPHFDGPPGTRRKKAGQPPRALAAVPAIGFMAKAGPAGAARTIDIEHCPIGTPAVAAGLARERARVARDFASFHRGATILLRESTQRFSGPAAEQEAAAAAAADPDAVTVPAHPDGSSVDVKTCITDSMATATEYVGDLVFTNPAGSFFQNNNSILPALTAYVRDAVAAPAAQPATTPPLRYLIDAYCGSGLFTIALAATLPGGSVGIDIAAQSIAHARRNAALNRLPADRCRFLAADAAQLFAGVADHLAGFRADETAVVLDPPRKGCDAPFLRQLLAFAPARIVYVSCNVHTQARDVGMLVRGEVDAAWGTGKHNAVAPPAPAPAPAPGHTPARYEIASIRGFDFFPQTAHVEGIAVLNRADLV